MYLWDKVLSLERSTDQAIGEAQVILNDIRDLICEHIELKIIPVPRSTALYGRFQCRRCNRILNPACKHEEDDLLKRVTPGLADHIKLQP